MRWFLAITLGRPLGVILGSAYAGYLYLLNSIRRDPRIILAGITPVRWYCRASGLSGGVSAITFGRRVYCRTPTPWSDLIRHEHVHVAQYKRLGWVGFLARYGYEVARYGYRNAPLEREAYES